MGQAVIVANLGDGLYQARPVYDTRVIEKELERLNEETAKYSSALLRALNTLSLLEDEEAIARAAMNEVIGQWQQDLLNSGSPPEIAPPTEDDPETGLPWDPKDKAQEGPLFDAINSVRSGAGKAALTRDDDLDFAARRHVYDISGRKAMGHVGSDRSVPSSRVSATGYQADLVVELVSCGAINAARAVTSWSLNSSYPIFSDVATQVGVAYTYSATHPATHLWVAVLAHPDPNPGPEIPTITYPDDPAQKAAREQEAGLEKIEVPKNAPITPEKLSESVKKYGEAVSKRAAADREIARLTIEGLVRGRRVDALTALLAGLNSRTYDVWSATYVSDLRVGDVVKTAEPPGWMSDEYEQKEVLTGGYSPARVRYNERRWNLVPFLTAAMGQLSPIENMSAEAVFYAAATEPGWARWKPICRYGVITRHYPYENVSDVQLESLDIRLLDGETPHPALVLDPSEILTAVPISYPPCHGRAFHVDDEVLILFEGQDRDKPKIIGFRRAPRWCSAVTWSDV